MRVSFTTVAAGVVALVGAVGLVRGAVPLTHSAADSSSHDSSMGMSMGGGATSTAKGSAPAGGSAGQGGPIEVSGAYVQEPASPNTIASYFSLLNTTGTADTLIGVDSGAGQVTSIHTGDSMDVSPNGLALPAHKRVTLTVGNGHVMTEQPVGALVPGQTVNLVLHFANAPQLTVAAPVIAIGAAVPQIGG